MPERYSNTDDTGVAILNLCISKEIGWICRNTNNSDVGIDATVEQVIDDNPTAKFILVQLKTGLGNVYTDKNGNFVYYIKNVHYEYWLLSSIPVILVLCDPKTEKLYWQLIKKQNISKTNKQYNIIIQKTHQLNKDSLSELNTIIDTYQTDFVLPESDNEDIYDPEYWNELLVNCSEAISNTTLALNQLTDKCRSHNDSMVKFIEQHQNRIEKNEVMRQITKHAKAKKIAIDICKTQLKNQIPIITETHIEAIRLAEQALYDNSISDVARNCIQELLCNELETIESSIKTFKKGADIFLNASSPTYELRQSEHSFALVLNDFVAELEGIIFGVKHFNKTLSNSD